MYEYFNYITYFNNQMYSIIYKYCMSGFDSFLCSHKLVTVVSPADSLPLR